MTLFAWRNAQKNWSISNCFKNMSIKRTETTKSETFLRLYISLIPNENKISSSSRVLRRNRKQLKQRLPSCVNKKKTTINSSNIKVLLFISISCIRHEKTVQLLRNTLLLKESISLRFFKERYHTMIFALAVKMMIETRWILNHIESIEIENKLKPNHHHVPDKRGVIKHDHYDHQGSISQLFFDLVQARENDNCIVHLMVETKYVRITCCHDRSLRHHWR